jgi:trk system potassium uptake protein TrkH
MLLMLFSISMLPPILVAYIYSEPFILIFLSSFILIFSCGLLLWFFCKGAQHDIQMQDGFFLVVLFWVTICIFASFPFFVSLQEKYSWLDVFFETVSGLTTTGITIFAFPETLPKAVLYYRQQLQFIGGMGIIVLTIAIMPFLGIGGTRLYRTEIPGSFKDNKFTPRVTQTAKALWIVYLLLAIACIGFFKLIGLDWFASICEGFATISTGGLMLQSQGLAFYNNTWLEWGAPIFMLAGSINFGLHYMMLKKRKWSVYWSEEEFRYFFRILLIAIIVISLLYISKFRYLSMTEFRHIYFTVLSVMSSSGSSCTNYASWPLPLLFVLIMISIIGGCHGSTSGGIKVIRALLLSRFYFREIKVLLHPQAISFVKYNHKPLENNIILSLFAFISAFIGLYITLVFLMTVLQNDLLSSIGMVTATLSNSGIGIGEVAISYANINLGSKILNIIAMLSGRLEIFSLFIVFSAHFWRD